MKKLLAGIAVPIVVLALIAAIPGPPSTDFTRGFGRVTNQAEAQAYLGVAGGGTTETNPVQNFYSSNFFTINGKGNTLVITQSVTFQFVKTNMLATDANGNVTTVKFGANISWDPATQTISASGGAGDTTGTNIVTLTQTGTNAAQLDFSLVARGGVFKLSLTNNAYFGVPANVNNTDFKHAWLAVKQPSTGTCFVTFTNGVFAQPGGNNLINDTNAGAVVWYELVSNPFTNGIVDVWMSQRSQLVP